MQRIRRPHFEIAAIHLKSLLQHNSTKRWRDRGDRRRFELLLDLVLERTAEGTPTERACVNSNCACSHQEPGSSVFAIHAAVHVADARQLKHRTLAQAPRLCLHYWRPKTWAVTVPFKMTSVDLPEPQDRLSSLLGLLFQALLHVS
jgi:hypothetical protein